MDTDKESMEGTKNMIITREIILIKMKMKKNNTAVNLLRVSRKRSALFSKPLFLLHSLDPTCS